MVVSKVNKLKEKRKRAIDSNILNSFYDLTDVADGIRLKAAQEILRSLASKQVNSPKTASHRPYSHEGNWTNRRHAKSPTW